LETPAFLFSSELEELGQVTEALKGLLRQDKSEENYLRALLLHLGCGFRCERRGAGAAGQACGAFRCGVAQTAAQKQDWLYSFVARYLGTASRYKTKAKMCGKNSPQ